MIHELKPYPAYKDSGVPWLGDVPEHWGVRKVSGISNRVTKGTTPTTLGRSFIDAGIRFVKVEAISTTGRVIHEQSAYIDTETNALLARSRLRSGDLLVAIAGAIGRVAVVQDQDLPANTNQAVGIISPIEGTVLSAWLAFVLSSSACQEFLTASSVQSAQANLSLTDLRGTTVPLPPLPEQSEIVRYLDHADRRIWRYIRAKQKLIKLLKEQKQAIIHRAVTRGLDPNVRLKPSGIEWLGNVPGRWSIERTKNLFRLRTQKSGYSHGLELLSIYTHIGVRPRKDLEERGNKATTTDDYWIVRKGDIIVNKLLAWMGAVGVSSYDGVTSPAYDILMPIRELVPEFYHHLFRTKLYLQLFKQRSRGIMDMRLRLYFDQLGQIPLVVPPLEEQSAIVAFYIDATADLDRTIGIAQREISLLREYRIRLIADVVTGKLDVREAAANLPVEPEESEVPLATSELDEEVDAESSDGDADAEE